MRSHIQRHMSISFSETCLYLMFVFIESEKQNYTMFRSYYEINTILNNNIQYRLTINLFEMDFNQFVYLSQKYLCIIHIILYNIHKL